MIQADGLKKNVGEAEKMENANFIYYVLFVLNEESIIKYL